MIQVLVLADSAVVRSGLQAMLREHRRFNLVRAAVPFADWTNLVLLQSGSHSDVVLIEVAAKRLLPLLSHRVADKTSIPLVLLTDEVSRGQLLRAIHAGVRAVLPRDAEPAEILAAIEAAASGLAAFGQDELELLIPASHTKHDDEPALEALSFEGD